MLFLTPVAYGFFTQTTQKEPGAPHSLSFPDRALGLTEDLLTYCLFSSFFRVALVANRGPHRSTGHAWSKAYSIAMMEPFTWSNTEQGSFAGLLRRSGAVFLPS